MIHKSITVATANPFSTINKELVFHLASLARNAMKLIEEERKTIVETAP